MNVESIQLSSFYAWNKPVAMSCINCGSAFHEVWDCPKPKKSTAARSNAREMVVRTCEVCAKTFEVRAFEVKRGKGRTCSKACAAQLASRPDQSGEANPNWKGGVPATEKNRRYIEKHPEKHTAHLAMTAAIRRGELVRKPCEVCGDPKTDGHHDDYSKPLEVRWLCRVHHIEHHTAGTQAPPVDTVIGKRAGRPQTITDMKAYKAAKAKQYRLDKAKLKGKPDA
jgi:hypothetical protein